MRSRPRAFSLIELLVVVAVIALLISLLLPALRKAKIEAWKVVSMSNVRQIAMASAMYKAENKGYLPLTPYGSPPNAAAAALYSSPTNIGDKGFCTWSAWGKYCSATYWANDPMDVPPASRPLNSYLGAEPPSPNNNLAQRKLYQVLVCRDPSDKVGHQRNWSGQKDPVENADGLSCYDDVGTSYHWQAGWHYQAKWGRNRDSWTLGPGQQGISVFRYGTERLKAADSYVTSRMIFVQDEWADITMYREDPNARVRNWYGDINRSVVAFLDGHAKYQRMIPGGGISPFDLPIELNKAFNNEEYTVIFPKTIPRDWQLRNR